MSAEKLPQWQADRLATLLDAISGVPISGAERASLEWLAGFEAATVENIAGLIRRARDRSGVLAARRTPEKEERLRRQLSASRDEVISRHREADFYRLQLVDLCEWAGVEPGEDPYEALLAHLQSGSAER